MIWRTVDQFDAKFNQKVPRESAMNLFLTKCEHLHYMRELEAPKNWIYTKKSIFKFFYYFDFLKFNINRHNISKIEIFLTLTPIFKVKSLNILKSYFRLNLTYFS